MTCEHKHIWPHGIHAGVVLTDECLDCGLIIETPEAREIKRLSEGRRTRAEILAETAEHSREMDAIAEGA